jgi:hypothetical protein
MTAAGRSFLYDSLLDWIVLGLLALEGLALAAVGATLVPAADRGLAREVAADVVAETEDPLPFTEAALADTIHTMVLWAGVALVVAGLLSIAAGVWFRRYRGGVRDRLDAGDSAPRWHAPALGGLLATALAFVPVVQLLGGAAAGAVSEGSATLDGALAGLLFGAPAFALWAALIAAPLAAGTPLVAVLAAVIFAFYVVFDVVLGALGGLAAGLLT